MRSALFAFNCLPYLGDGSIAVVLSFLVCCSQPQLIIYGRHAFDILSPRGMGSLGTCHSRLVTPAGAPAVTWLVFVMQGAHTGSAKRDGSGCNQCQVQRATVLYDFALVSTPLGLHTSVLQLQCCCCEGNESTKLVIASSSLLHEKSLCKSVPSAIIQKV